MIPAIVLLILFLLIAGPTRGTILSGVSSSVDWIKRQPPVSQVAICALLGALVVALLLLALWPKPTKSRRPPAQHR